MFTRSATLRSPRRLSRIGLNEGAPPPDRSGRSPHANPSGASEVRTLHQKRRPALRLRRGERSLQPRAINLSGTGVSYIPLIGRNSYREPRTINLHLRAQKDFLLAEKYNLELIGEALANHQNATTINSSGYVLSTVQSANTTEAPTSTLTYQPTFGSVTAANANNAYQVRQVLLALRLTF